MHHPKSQFSTIINNNDKNRFRTFFLHLSNILYYNMISKVLQRAVNMSSLVHQNVCFGKPDLCTSLELSNVKNGSDTNTYIKQILTVTNQRHLQKIKK